MKMSKIESSHWWYVTLHELILKKINSISNNNNLRIIDIGCGNGSLLEKLEKYKKFNLSGIEFNEFALKECYRKNLDFVENINLNEWTPEPNKYDIIICLDVLQDQGLESDKILLDKMIKSLKYKGLIFINIPAFKYLSRYHDDFVGIKKRYSINLFEGLISNQSISYFMSYRMIILFFLIPLMKILRNFKIIRRESDLKNTNIYFNYVLKVYGKIENIIIQKNIRIPFGSSIYVVIKK